MRILRGAVVGHGANAVSFRASGRPLLRTRCARHNPRGPDSHMSSTDTAVSSDQLSPTAKRVLMLAFLTLVIDLIGFSIIFPLFPAMLDHYRAHESGTGLFALLERALSALAVLIGSPQHDAGVTVLFGGILGSLYSLLQFLFAPLFGALSDRMGRRKVLVMSLVGILIAEAVWFFAAEFWLLILSRTIAGITSANITTVSALVSDVTTTRTRAKGLALIGIAFGVGFTLGPAIGGLSTLLDLTAYFPGGVAYGLNPWSTAAAIAFLLTLFNLVQVVLYMPETHPESARGEKPFQFPNPFRLFRTGEYPGVSRTGLAYFIFVLAFSGMEFSLTFFAKEKFGYTERNNAMLFLAIGFVLALVQGGYVQRRAHKVGPRRMALHGLLFIVPGLILVGLSGQLLMPTLLYIAIILLAAGSAQATPCLTSMVSLYTPASEQGRVMGVFRSLGALGRATGPLLACAVYWRMGAAPAYYFGALVILLPVLITRTLPEPPTAAAPIEPPLEA